MRFAEWMTQEGLDDEAVVKRIETTGVRCDRTMVSRYRRGLRRPDWQVLAAINQISDGNVTPTDFLECETSE